MQVVVLGRNYSSLLGMIRAVGQAGYMVTVIRTVNKIPAKMSIKKLVKGAPIESKSKYVKKYLYAIEPDGKGMIEMIKKEFNEVEEKIVLLPTDDFVAAAIDLHQKLLDQKFLFPHIEHRPGAVVELMDKEFQKKVASEVGLKVVKGWTVKIKNGKYQIPEEIEYPSFMGDKQCMKRCDNVIELENVIAEVADKADCPILIEKYIEIEHEYAILGYTDGKTVVLPGVIELLQSGSGAHRGVTLLGELKAFDGIEPLKQQLQHLIETLHFIGLFDIDVYRAKGNFYFNELNMRFGASGYAITKAGINLPEMLIHKLSGEKGDKITEQVITKCVFVNEKVNLEDYAAGYITWGQYQHFFKQAQFRFIKSEGDPAPYLNFKIQEILQRLKRVISNMYFDSDNIRRSKENR